MQYNFISYRDFRTLKVTNIRLLIGTNKDVKYYLPPIIDVKFYKRILSNYLYTR